MRPRGSMDGDSETIHPLALGLARAPEAPEGLVWVTEEALAGLPMGRRDSRLREHLALPAKPRPLDGEEWAAAKALLA